MGSAMKTTAAYVGVLEDNVIFHPQFPQAIGRFLRDFTAIEWDALQIDPFGPVSPPIFEWEGYSIYNPQDLPSCSTFGYNRGGFWGAHATIFKMRAVQSVLRTMQQNPVVLVDHLQKYQSMKWL